MLHHSITPPIDAYSTSRPSHHITSHHLTTTPSSTYPHVAHSSLQETEEDSTIGVEGIIHYVIGRYPSSREAKDPVARKYEVYEWRKRLRQFHAGKLPIKLLPPSLLLHSPLFVFWAPSHPSSGKDLLWKALDFNTYVDPTVVNAILTLFPEEPTYRRQRQEQELVKYF